MSPSPENHDPLKPLIDRTLRAQPLRRAPRTLESRVLAELARRAALPWWHRSYAHWPAAVRAAFFILSALAAAVLISVLFLLRNGAASAELGELSGLLGWLSVGREIFSTVADKTLVVWGAIPPLWLYGAAAIVGGSLATLVGVGGAAYRAFLAPR